MLYPETHRAPLRRDGHAVREELAVELPRAVAQGEDHLRCGELGAVGELGSGHAAPLHQEAGHLGAPPAVVRGDRQGWAGSGGSDRGAAVGGGGGKRASKGRAGR